MYDAIQWWCIQRTVKCKNSSANHVFFIPELLVLRVNTCSFTALTLTSLPPLTLCTLKDAALKSTSVP